MYYVGFYSEALPGTFRVFSCALEPLQDESTPPVLDPQSNLLINASFDSLDADNKPQAWTKGCTGLWGSIESPLSAAALQLDSLGHPSCASQALSPEKVELLSKNTYTIECEAINNQSNGGYAAVKIVHGSKEHWHEIPTSIEATGILNIDNCSLLAGDGASGENLALIDVRTNVEGLDIYDTDAPFSFDVVLSNIGSVPVNNIGIVDRHGCTFQDSGLHVTQVAELQPGESVVRICETNTALTDSTDFIGHEIFARGIYANNSESFGVDSVYDHDQIAYTSSLEAGTQAVLAISAKQATIKTGEDATFTVSVAATGMSSSIARVGSEQATCIKDYASPLTTGQYDVYDCVVENVTSNLTVSIEALSGNGVESVLLNDSTTVNVE